MSRGDNNSTKTELFSELLAALNDVGYSDDLLQRDYRFRNYFDPHVGTSSVPAAAFGQTPTGYDSACFAVVIANHKSGIELIHDCRALGAPRAFEVRSDRVVHWRVSLNPTPSDEFETILPANLATHFRQHRQQWQPGRVLRAKDVAAPGPRQTDFVDAGLIPALEEHVKAKLGPLLKSILHDATRIYTEAHGDDPDHNQLVRLVFRALTWKVMYDRDVRGFDLTPAPPNAKIALKKIAEHYHDSEPILTDAAVQQTVIDRLWHEFGFENLSVEVLAFIWEDTLVTDELRQRYGIHATPAAVARYLTHRLPIGDFRRSERRVVEPCSGSGVFLVAALQRLRELLPPLMNARKRHRYLQQMLTGFDIETFGREVARSCLMLADFPNPNGWRLRQADVFREPASFKKAMHQARVVLCNPPFEDFTEVEKEEYEWDTPRKPAEILRIVLDHLHPNGVLGFVLPAVFLEGRSYRDLRRRLAERFQRLEVVRLPDKTFERAEFPSTLLLATLPSAGHREVSVSFAAVTDEEKFLKTGDVGYIAEQTRTIADVQRGIGAPALQELWEFLEPFAKLKGATKKLSRGVEWNDFDKERDIADKPKRGYVLGFHTAEMLSAFQPPSLVYLSNREESRRGGAWDLPWHEQKVVINAIRKARQPWRVAACPVELNVVASQNFTVAWPIGRWTPNSLAAVLNGPVAAAYVDAHESWKHNKKKTLASIPLPDLDEKAIQILDDVVMKYRKVASLAQKHGEQAGLFGGVTLQPALEHLLLVIDTIILRGYRLPVLLQNQLFAYFGKHQRPVPFPSGIAAVERGIGETLTSPETDLRDYYSQWELFRKTLEDERYGQRSLFRP